MSTPLSAYNARAGLSQLTLEHDFRRLAERLLALAEAEPDGRVPLSRVYADLFRPTPGPVRMQRSTGCFARSTTPPRPRTARSGLR